MDVPEASKHGKKSTSQKLEDQKKVGKTLLFFFLFTFFCGVFWFSKNFGFCCCPVVCTSKPRDGSLFDHLVCSLYKKENILVQLLPLSEFPLAPLLHIS